MAFVPPIQTGNAEREDKVWRKSSVMDTLSLEYLWWCNTYLDLELGKRSDLTLDEATKQIYEVGLVEEWGCGPRKAPNSGQLLICSRSVIWMALVSVGSVQTALVLTSLLPSLAVNATWALMSNEESLMYLSPQSFLSGTFWRWHKCQAEGKVSTQQDKGKAH